MRIIRLKTPITYYGGKQGMLKHIIPLIPEHTLYNEAFAGGAALFFAKSAVKVNVINDLNGELVNFYRTIVTDYPALKLKLSESLHSRLQHEHAWYVYNHSTFFSNVERAWAVFVLSKLGFAGQLTGVFGFDKSEGRQPKKIKNAMDLVNEDLKALLELTTIECDDALKVIKRYDCSGAFHFIDPPYVGSDMGHYKGMFNNENLLQLLHLMVDIQGKFMLTMYPNDVIKQFADANGWTVHKVERQISAAKVGSRRKQEEWIVMNYGSVGVNQSQLLEAA